MTASPATAAMMSPDALLATGIPSTTAAPVVARLLTNDFNKMVLLSVGVGAFCGLGGLYASFYVDISSGPAVVLFSAAFFVIVLAYTSIRERITLNRARTDGRTTVTLPADPTSSG